MTKSGWNRSKHVEAISLRSVARRKKERKKEETSKIQYPAGDIFFIIELDYWFDTNPTDYSNWCVPSLPCVQNNVIKYGFNTTDVDL